MIYLKGLSYVYYIQRFNNLDSSNSFKSYDKDELVKYLEFLKYNIVFCCIYVDVIEVLFDKILFFDTLLDKCNIDTIIIKLDNNEIITCIIKNLDMLYKITIHKNNNSYMINIYNKNINLFEDNDIYSQQGCDGDIIIYNFNRILNIAFDIEITINDVSICPIKLWEPIIFIKDNNIIHDRMFYDITNPNKKKIENFDICKFVKKYQNSMVKLFLNKSDITHDENSKDVIIYIFKILDNSIHFTIE